MRRQVVFLIMLWALLAAAVPFGNTTQAQVQGSRLDQSFQVERIQLDGETPLAPNVGGSLPAVDSRPVKVVVELHDRPTTQIFADAQTRMSAAQATIQAQQQLGRIQAVQQTVLASLQAPAIGAQVLYRTQRVFNGIAVQVSPDRLAQIQALPEVKAVHPLVSKQLDNASSVALIGAPSVWDQAQLSATGKGLKIGIIDGGIDYTHANFGGPGTVEAYEENDPTTIDDNDLFPSAKVVGGYDFVGDDYNASDPANATPQPDPDPIDCDGHGTHVAGTAAGFGVKEDGSTYTGPYGPDTPFNDLKIGPGVAPEAELYALRVFGCAGTTAVTDLAIEWAVDPNGDGDFSDRLDVINMSLGALYGSAFDVSAVVSDNAASVGVVVVASAGNSGDTYYITGAPAAAARAISVASSVDSTDVLDGFRVNAPTAIAGIKPSSYGSLYDFATKPDVTGDLAYPPTQRSGCQAFDATNAAAINGKVALLDWTIIDGTNECGSATRVNNAADAGATGVVLVYPQSFIAIAIGGSTRIPSTITVQEVGAELKAKLDQGVNVTLTDEYNASQKLVVEARTDTLSTFSSRGIRRSDSLLKPDLAAPGQTITSARVGSGTESWTINGTSMAAPHVAGFMALLRQIHPDWSVEELKALAINTANNDLRSDLPKRSAKYGPGRVGAGRVDAADASQAPAIAYNADNRGVVSVSFGAPEVVGKAIATKTIRVLNKTDKRQTYKVSYDGRVDVPGVRYLLSTPLVTLPPYGFADIVVAMIADADKMKHTHDPTVSEAQAAPPLPALPRHWLSEEAGLVVLTPNRGPKLRVPVYAAPRPASAMRAESQELSFDDDATAAIDLVGQDVLTGREFPLDEVSIVTAFELQHSSPNDAHSRDIVNNADLKYVGVASDFPATSAISDTVISFGIATHGNWSSPNEVQFNVFIDTDRDGTPDFLLLNVDTGSATGTGGVTDTFITALFDLDRGGILQSFLNGVPASVANTVPFNNNVMLLPMFADDLGLTDENATFDYQVVSVSRDDQSEDEDQVVNDLQAVDSTPVLTYNAAAPGVDLFAGEPGIPAYFDLDGNSIPVAYDGEAFAANKSQGILLLHHHNATPDRRPEVITLVDAAQDTSN